MSQLNNLNRGRTRIHVEHVSFFRVENKRFPFLVSQTILSCFLSRHGAEAPLPQPWEKSMQQDTDQALSLGWLSSTAIFQVRNQYIRDASWIGRDDNPDATRPCLSTPWNCFNPAAEEQFLSSVALNISKSRSGCTSKSAPVEQRKIRFVDDEVDWRLLQLVSNIVYQE